MHSTKATQLVLLFTLQIFQTMAQNSPTNPKEVVSNFLLEVRSGKNPAKAKDYMSDKILAHSGQL